ncbi:MAG: DapH/DapD/GlmU-related protein [Elusimicrobiales bacterium]|nr:DapH/DapD/GlmU-related protein [Elusimicrobiales bacterium]
MNIFSNYVDLFFCEGSVNFIARAVRSVLLRGRGFLLLGRGNTCGEGFRLIGRKHVVFHGEVSFGVYCRVEAYSKYKGQEFRPRIEIGKSAHFGDMLHIGAIGHIHIGDNVLFGSKILVIDHDHGRYSGPECALPASIPINRELFQRGDIYIGNNVWVGENAMIFGGANIGDGSIVAAGAIVTGIVPPGTICVGKNKIIKKFKPDSKEWIRLSGSGLMTGVGA